MAIRDGHANGALTVAIMFCTTGMMNTSSPTAYATSTAKSIWATISGRFRIGGSVCVQ